MNSNFLNLLKKKNLETSNNNNNQNHSHQQNFTNHVNIQNSNVESINKLKEKASNVVQITYNNNMNNTNVVQINNYMKDKTKQQVDEIGAKSTKTKRKDVSPHKIEAYNKNNFKMSSGIIPQMKDLANPTVSNNKNFSHSNQNLHDKESLGNKSQHSGVGVGNGKGFQTQVNINVLNNLNNLGTIIPSQIYARGEGVVGNLQNSMLQSKKVYKKKAVDLSANNTAVNTGFGAGKTGDRWKEGGAG